MTEAPSKQPYVSIIVYSSFVLLGSRFSRMLTAPLRIAEVKYANFKPNKAYLVFRTNLAGSETLETSVQVAAYVREWPTRFVVCARTPRICQFTLQIPKIEPIVLSCRLLLLFRFVRCPISPYYSPFASTTNLILFFSQSDSKRGAGNCEISCRGLAPRESPTRERLYEIIRVCNLGVRIVSPQAPPSDAQPPFRADSLVSIHDRSASQITFT